VPVPVPVAAVAIIEKIIATTPTTATTGKIIEIQLAVKPNFGNVLI